MKKIKNSSRTDSVPIWVKGFEEINIEHIDRLKEKYEFICDGDRKTIIVCVKKIYLFKKKNEQEIKKMGIKNLFENLFWKRKWNAISNELEASKINSLEEKEKTIEAQEKYILLLEKLTKTKEELKKLKRELRVKEKYLMITVYKKTKVGTL